MTDRSHGDTFLGSYVTTLSGPFDSGWSVQIIAADPPVTGPDGTVRGQVTVTGVELPTEKDRIYRYYGNWTDHPKYGLQYRCDAATEEFPVTEEGIEAFLSSGFVEGIGPVTARRIVARFGTDTFRIIEHEPERLREIPRLSRKRIEQLSTTFREKARLRGMVALLTPYGVSPRLTLRIMEHFDDPLRVVRETPYALCGSRIGIGFRTADQIARAQGLQPASMLRYASGIRFILRQNEGNGHTVIPWDDLMTRSLELLRIPDLLEPRPEHLVMTLAQMQRQRMIRVEDDALTVCTIDPETWLHPGAPPSRTALYVANAETARTEIELCALIHGHLRRTVPPIPDLERRLAAAEKGLGFTPSEPQRAAVRVAASHPLMLLTGVPGSGKTTTLRLLLNTLQAKRPLLTAPTGRAARRMAESTGLPAETLHRALGFRTDDGETEFYQTDETPLSDSDLVVVDEMSMTDLRLAERLFDALSPTARLVLVGDPDQLPSVGAGQVLGDLLRVAELPQVRLDVVFRQGDQSQIVSDAARIRAGHSSLDYGSEVRFVDCPDPAAAHAAVVELYTELTTRIPADELMVLTPMKGRRRGSDAVPQPAGTIALNRDLQAAVNPAGKGTPELVRKGRIWREGDRVMMLRNQLRAPKGAPEREVMISNGDTGVLLAIEHGPPSSDPDDASQGDRLLVRFNGDTFRFDASDTDRMEHAYAATIHKSQGSEYRVVIIVLLKSHYVMLRRNLIYTALTRAKEQVYIVGQADAVRTAIETVRDIRRHTLLDRRLSAVLGSADQGTDAESAMIQAHDEPSLREVHDESDSVL